MNEWLRIEEVPSSIGISSSTTLQISYPQQGMTSDVAFVRVGSQELVVKRCKQPIYLDWLRREYEVLRWLEGSGLAIPKACDYDEIVSHDGPEGWLTMTRLPGRSLKRHLMDMRPGHRTALLHQFGSAVRSLHSTQVPTYPSGQRSWLSRKLIEAENHLSWCDGSASLLESLALARPAEIPETLVHGDLALDNVLIDSSLHIGFIDWSAGDVGDPRYDLALVMKSDASLAFTEAEVAAFYSGYGGEPLGARTERWFLNLCEFF